MALLNDFLSRRSLIRVSTGLMVLTAAGCALAGVFGGGEERLAFSHRIHTEEGLECSSCHMDWETSDEPGMPTLAACMLCHESMEEENSTPPEKKVATLFDEGGLKGERLTRLPEENVFSHMRHANAELECSACHVGIETSERVDENVVVTMTDCMTCHSEKKVANECSTCHSKLGPDYPPNTHEQNWRKQHGRVVRAHAEGTANDCSLCHTEQTCVSCHRDEQPESHNEYFLDRGHGIQASIDRQSCMACHRPEMCDRCHSSTEPKSHNGSWGAPRDSHCVGCHDPLKATSCYACHKDTPSHRMAPPKPPGHNPAMNCRLCHGMGAPMPHVDNGSDCNSCHR